VSYNPFNRGPAPVGVRTVTATDASRGRRTLTIEIWYPATERYCGQDLDETTRDRFIAAPGLPEFSQSAVRGADAALGTYPLLLHTHGALSHRRAMSVLCTHLASHGYVVASNDVPGNTIVEMLRDAEAQRRGTPLTAPSQQETGRHRFRDASFVISAMLAGAEPDIATRIDPTRIGALGQSAGGWTTMGVNSIDRRVGANFVMEPLYGKRSPLPQLREMSDWLRVDDWGRPVPTFLLAGEKDPMVILEDLRDLYAKLPAPKRFANLAGAGHMHFADNAEQAHEMFRGMYLTSFPDPSFDTHALGVAMRPFSELCSEAAAHDTMRALCLAHMDEQLKDKAEAAAFLNDHLEATFRARGIELQEVASETALVPA
jgi:predicted dienelactone hydrolase